MHWGCGKKHGYLTRKASVRMLFLPEECVEKAISKKANLLESDIWHTHMAEFVKSVFKMQEIIRPTSWFVALVLFKTMQLWTTTYSHPYI